MLRGSGRQNAPSAGQAVSSRRSAGPRPSARRVTRAWTANRPAAWSLGPIVALRLGRADPADDGV